MDQIDDRFLHRQQEALAEKVGALTDSMEEYIGKDENAFFERLQGMVDQYDRNKAALQNIQKGGDTMTSRLNELPDIMTPKEVADFLKVAERTVKVWLLKREMTGTKAGREWRILKTDLIAYLEKNKQQAKKK